MGLFSKNKAPKAKWQGHGAGCGCDQCQHPKQAWSGHGAGCGCYACKPTKRRAAAQDAWRGAQDHLSPEQFGNADT